MTFGRVNIPLTFGFSDRRLAAKIVQGLVQAELNTPDGYEVTNQAHSQQHLCGNVKAQQC